MRKSISTTDTHYVRGSMSVGPKHDPYHREFVTASRDGKVVWRLINCSLAGLFLERDGKKVEDRDEIESIIAMPISYALDRMWSNREYSIRRSMDKDAYMRMIEIEEADARLLRWAD